MTTIINKEAGLCLDGRFDQCVYTNVCIGKATQNWHRIGDNWQVASTNECLSFYKNAGYRAINAYTSSCNQTNVCQHWTLVQSTHLQVEYNGLCLQGNGLGNRVFLNKCNYEDPSQVWTIDDTDAIALVGKDIKEIEPDL